MRYLFFRSLTSTLLTVWLTIPSFASPVPNEVLLQRIPPREEKLATSEQQSPALLDALNDRIKLSGAIAVEANYTCVDNTCDDEDSSDHTLATVELGVDVDLIHHVSGHILLLWEEDDTEPMDVDEAFITLIGEEVLPLTLSAGKLYVPFGNFTSNMVSDPLPLELGETRESAVVVGYEQNGFYASLYAFNGDVEIDGNNGNQIDNVGASLGYVLEKEYLTLDVGICYTNNLLDSDGLGERFDEAVEEAEEVGQVLELQEHVGGFGAHLVAELGSLNLIGEYVGAIDAIAYRLDGVKFKEDAIRSWNLEAGYGFDFLGREALVAAGWQGSDNAGDFLPENRYLACISAGIFDGTSLALEMLHEEYENDGETDSITLQLAIEF
ncbi:MAG: LbtU family siderophore porin [Desulfuromonadaceae bacterium]|nr:LbtU family siderophore porin [Desulfuromonadaceae bacterium]